jgi:hypothetical protein
MSFFASNRFLVFFEFDRCPVIQLPLFAMGYLWLVNLCRLFFLVQF